MKTAVDEIALLILFHHYLLTTMSIPIYFSFYSNNKFRTIINVQQFVKNVVKQEKCSELKKCYLFKKKG